MRKLTRTAAPKCLQDHATNWTDEFVKKIANNPSHKFSWRNSACYQAIRQTLVSMTQRHCAFCDGLLGLTSRETVEHFRPKKIFPELAYAWDNLFPCCDLCQSIKLERFDEALLKADTEDYAFNNYFTVNYHTGEIEVSSRSDPNAQAKARITLELYGLNTKDRMKARIREMECFSRAETPYIDDYNYRYFLE